MQYVAFALLPTWPPLTTTCENADLACTLSPASLTDISPRFAEHIGTKTAVQIRSHAQKFFSKLEREQAAGNTSGTAPPPPPSPSFRRHGHLLAFGAQRLHMSCDLADLQAETRLRACPEGPSRCAVLRCSQVLTPQSCSAVLPENLNIPPPRPKRKPSHPYPRKAEPQSSEQLLPAQSWSGSLPTLAAAAAAATPSLQQHGATQAQARGAGPGPRHPTDAQVGAHARTSPFSAVQQQVHSGLLLHQPLVAADTAGGERQHGGQQLPAAEGHSAAVAAVAAAASAAAAAAAAAVVAAAEAHVQASLQANPPKGFPFFGLPPSILATMGLQLQSDAQVPPRPLAPCELAHRFSPSSCVHAPVPASARMTLCWVQPDGVSGFSGAVVCWHGKYKPAVMPVSHAH